MVLGLNATIDKLAVAFSLLGVSNGGVALLIVVLVAIASVWFFINWRKNGGHIEPVSQDEIEKHQNRKMKKGYKDKNKGEKSPSTTKNNEILVLKKHKGEKDE
ncbi:MAG: hypothetical protein ACI4L7_04325 [Christensenellales bacterium]